MAPITRTLQKFEEGAKASIVIDPSVHGGQPHNRFQGHTGTIMGSQGNSYKVQIFDGKKEKILIVSPDHLRKA